MKSDVRDWQTIGTYLFLHEAALASGRLEQEGIDTRVLDAGLVGVAPHLALSIGGVRLQVPSIDEELAKTILAMAQPLDEEQEEEVEGVVEVGTSPRGKLSRRALIALLILGTLVLVSALTRSGLG